MPSTTQAAVAVVVPYPFVPARSGGQKACYGYTWALARCLPRVSCLSSEGNAPTDHFALEACFPHRIVKYFWPGWGWRLRRRLQQLGARQVVLHHHYQGMLLWLCTRGLGLRLYVVAHNLEYQRWRSLGKWWWPAMWLSEWLVYRSAERVCFLSPDDQQGAQRAFGLPPAQTLYTPYGVWRHQAPDHRHEARLRLAQQHQLDHEAHWLLFFGPQHYAPNLAAVETIVFEIHPLLRRHYPHFKYQILLCGGGLPAHHQGFADLRAEGVHYLGFIDHIDDYILAADLSLNPITQGGGVKTKVIEAVALGATVLSSQAGAMGLHPEVFGAKLHTVPHQPAAYAEAIVRLCALPPSPTPAAFYQHYYWEHAVAPLVELLAEQ